MMDMILRNMTYYDLQGSMQWLGNGWFLTEVVFGPRFETCRFSVKLNDKGFNYPLVFPFLFKAY